MSQEYYITDKNGRRIAVQIPVKKYEKLLADAEELKNIYETSKAKLYKSDHLHLDSPFKEIFNDNGKYLK